MTEEPGAVRAGLARPRRRHVAWAAAVATLPAALTLAVLAALAPVPTLHAAAALLAAALGGLVVARRHIGPLAAIEQALAGARAPGDPTLTAIAEESGPVGELAATAIRRAKATAGLIAELHELATRRAAVIDSVPEPLIQLDADGRIEAANPAALVEFGERIVGRDLSGVLRHPALLEAADAVRTGVDGRSVEIGLSEPVERNFEVRIGPLPSVDGGIRGAVLLFEDLTEMRRLEGMRADFVANVSHELRTPLATLHGFIETLRGPAKDDAEARVQFLGIMEEQSTRMTRLVSDLLSLSRIEAKEHAAPTGRVDLGALLSRVAATEEIEARRKGMRIVLDLPADLPRAVGDDDELAQVAHNLIENAVKYGRPETEVTVSAFVPTVLPPSFPGPVGRAVAFSVRDRGEGIPREHIPRLTERFYRVDTARSRKLGGTGLGLAIVKHIASRHRGTLTIESTAGAGSTFAVYLPRVK